MHATDSTPASPPPFLEIRNVRKSFGGVKALKEVSLVIEAGQIYHLMGENGCGKSTLIKILSGAQPADEGRFSLMVSQQAPLLATLVLSVPCVQGLRLSIRICHCCRTFLLPKMSRSLNNLLKHRASSRAGSMFRLCMKRRGALWPRFICQLMLPF